MGKEFNYGEAGVNRELGDSISEILYNSSKETWRNREGKLGELIVPFDDFSGVRAIDVSELPKGTLMNLGFDGVGTKIELAERTMKHDTVAYDMFAMVCDDAVVRGAEPVLIGSILDINSLEGNIDFIRQLVDGYINAANESGVAVVNGEVAELGARVIGYSKPRKMSIFDRFETIKLSLTDPYWNKILEESLKEQNGFNYNWGAGVVWFANKERIFTGNEIEVGDSLIGFKQEGFRSNGISLVRRILRDKFGGEWHNEIYNEPNCSYGDLVLYPSRIYSRAIVNMTGGWDPRVEPKAEIHGIVHVTGGGIPGKLGRVLKPSGLGAMIDDPFEPNEFVLYVQDLGNVPDKEAYKTWGMQQGMITITPEPDKVVSLARDYKIDSKRIGEVVSKQGIKIKNKGAFRFKSNSELIY